MTENERFDAYAEQWNAIHDDEVELQSDIFDREDFVRDLAAEELAEQVRQHES